MNKLPTFPKFDVLNHREDYETYILNYIKDLNIEFVICVNYATPYYGTMVLRSNAVDIMMKLYEEASTLAISSAIQADIYRDKRITIQNFALTGSLGFNNITGNLISSPDEGLLYDFKLICNIQSNPV